MTIAFVFFIWPIIHHLFTLFMQQLEMYRCANFSNNNEVFIIEGGRHMSKRNPNSQNVFEFDEQGTNEVSEQILNSYNSGFIGEGSEQTESSSTEG